MLNNIGICLAIIKVAINGSVKPVMNFLKSKKEDVIKRLGKKKGVAALCIGGGEATAVAIEV
jgi:glutamine amidotransferase PdxT